MSVTYRMLPNEELHKFEARMRSIGQVEAIPEKGTYRVAVAETESGEIVGFQVLQLALHAEPLWIDDARANKVSISNLFHLIEKEIPGVLVYVFSDTDRAFPKRFGFEELPFKVWSKRVALPEEEVA
jgi:hypothetical protein